MYKLNERDMFYDFADNQAIVINSTTGIYYAMNTLGSVIFDFVTKGASLKAVVNALKELEGCPENIEDSLNEFFQKLADLNILLVSDADTDVNVVLSKEYLEDGFALSVDEFDEAADLILADPIHEVDVEMGIPSVKQSNK